MAVANSRRENGTYSSEYNGMTGKNHTDETKAKMREKKLGTKQKTIPCQFCRREIGNTNIKRHENVCKSKKD